MGSLDSKREIEIVLHRTDLGIKKGYRRIILEEGLRKSRRAKGGEIGSSGAARPLQWVEKK